MSPECQDGSAAALALVPVRARGPVRAGQAMKEYLMAGNVTYNGESPTGALRKGSVDRGGRASNGAHAPAPAAQRWVRGAGARAAGECRDQAESAARGTLRSALSTATAPMAPPMAM
ncbi:hypothetical protein GCM10009099_08690 [Caenispirillum bisanense]